MSTRPDLSLPRFEGPLDLLLELVRRNEIDIQDIPIAEVTRQYLDYLRRAEQLDLELSSEFAYIASVLIHIKSRCLLVRDPEIAAREADPRQELVRMLLDHDQIRQGAEFLKQKLEVAEASWSKSSVEEYRDTQGEQIVDGNACLNLLEVLRLAQQALSTARVFEVVTPADSVTVDQMVGWLEQELAGSPGPLEAGVLLTQQCGAQRRAALFLAILEMTRQARIHIEQSCCFGPILMGRADPRAQLCHNTE